MPVYFHEEAERFSLKNKRKIKRWLSSVALLHKQKKISLSYVFITDDAMLQLNNTHLKHNYYTDILTFNTSVNNLVLCADIFISVDTVKSNAAIYKCSFDEELLRVMVHGLLHLLGYNDKTEEEKKKMRLVENQCLKTYPGC